MATPTDEEPRPRNPVRSWTAQLPASGDRYALPKPANRPNRSFFEVLQSRRSRPGTGILTEADISCLVWHSMLLRERRAASEFFLDWESRASPSAGGLHPIHLLLVSTDSHLPVGFYDPRRHEIVELVGCTESLIKANAASVEKICAARSGMTIQLVADWSKVEAAYVDGESLLWRDAGALTATIALVAEALQLAAIPLGRTGSELLAISGLKDPRWRGVGAIHIQGIADAG